MAAPVPAMVLAIAGHVGRLAAPEMEGRGIGTEGIERAARYIEEEFRTIGLEAPPGGYGQPLEVTVGTRLASGNRLTLGSTALSAGREWVPIAFSESGPLSGEVVFAGYGITAPSLGYDDYAGADLTGKIALVLRYEPQDDDPKSVFAGTAHTVHATLRAKAANAKRHGAAGLIVVTGPAGHLGEGDLLVGLELGGAEASAGIPCVHVAATALARAGGPASARLLAWQRARDRDLAAAPPDLAAAPLRASGTVALVRERRTTRNVVGLLRGSTGEAVVIGAHYDHLGMGGSSSLAPGRSELHPGADDNASGVAALIETARSFAARGTPPRRTMVFAAFTGEESGLLGSAHYVRHAPVPVSRTVAMLNFDMVGRLKENSLHVMGTDTSPAWRPLVERAVAEEGISARYTGGGYGPSDHSSFYAARVPVLFFFTGAYADYHRPSDTADKVDAAGASRVVAIALRVLSRVDEMETAPAYAEVAGTPPSIREGGGGGYGPYFGVIPQFGDEETGGVRLTGVGPRSPAARAGLAGGDLLVSFGGARIGNLYDLTYALRAHKVGDNVEVAWLRDGKRMRGEATLARRGAPPAGAGHGGEGTPTAPIAPAVAVTPLPGERFFSWITQLTFGGENAEAYWSPDGQRLVFQSTRDGGACDQIYVMRADGSGVQRISSGKGRCTCAFFLDAGRILFSSTHLVSPDCPERPDHSRGYVWALHPGFDVYAAKDDGSQASPLVSSPGYDAEATVSRDGRWVVLTSTRSGDPEVYLMRSDGTQPRRLTFDEGYDGGAVFSPDGRKIAWRASRPAAAERASYRGLMARNLVRPSRLEIHTLDLTTGRAAQVTRNGAANFAPTWHPDGRRILFSSNLSDPKGRNFDLYLVQEDGSGTTAVTTYDGFDSFPDFSPDGGRLAFASNRGGSARGETNVFVAGWTE